MNFGSNYDWQQVGKVTIGAETSLVYENKFRRCAVLIDNTKGTPIVSVSIEAQEGKTLMAKRGKERNFLSIFEKDDQTFNFRITNLTADKFFFVLRHGKEEDKGKVVNQINLLDAKQTIVVKSDTSNDERAMVVKKKVDEKTGQGITVEQAETKDTSTNGTYFTFGVAPIVDGADWGKAVWTPVQYVCCEEDKEQNFSGGGGWGSQHKSISGDGFAYNSSSRFMFDGPPQQTAATGGSGGGWSSAQSSPAPVHNSSRGCGFGGGGPPADGGFSYNPGFSPSSPSYSPASPGFSPSSPCYSPAAEFSSYEKDSFATNLSHGNVQTVSSREVQLDVKFKMASPTAVFCLAVISPNRLQIFDGPSEEMKKKLIMDSATDFICGKNKRLLETITKVHAEEECSICMDAVPAYIFIKCGHSCICKNCSKQLREQRCPLCRAFIEAKLDK